MKNMNPIREPVENLCTKNGKCKKTVRWKF